MRVLVVDDQPDHRDLIRDALEHYFSGLEIVETGSAEETVAALGHGCLDGIVLDYVLPDGTALELLPRILELCPDTPVVVTTARGDETVAVQALKSGASDYIVKSGHLAEHLPRALDSAMERARLRRQTEHDQQRIAHLNSVLRAIRNVNELITHERNQPRLLQQACELLIETRGYGAAWVVLIGADGQFAEGHAAGFEPGQLESLLETLRAGETSRCLGLALEQPGEVIAVPGTTDHGNCPLRSWHQQTGVFVKAMTCRDELCGLLGVTVPPEMLNDVEEQSLFAEVVADIALAMHMIDEEERRRTAEADLRYLNQLHGAIARIAETILRLREREPLLQEICRIAMEQAGFVFVGFGFLDHATDEVVPTVHCGREDGYLVSLPTAPGAPPESLSPGVRSIREGVPVLVEDLEAEPGSYPWITQGRERGYRSIAAFPIRLQGRPDGTLVVYSDRPRFFDESRVNLLLGLAGDVSFALDAIEQEQLRRNAEAAMQRSEQTFRTFTEMAPVGIAIRRGLDLLYVNPTLLKLAGYARQEDIPGGEALALYAPEDRERIRAMMLARDEGKEQPSSYEEPIYTRDGQRLPHHLDVANIELPDGPATIAFYTDLSQRLQIEANLRREIAERERAEELLLRHQAELRSLAVELSLAEERERRRVGTQLHDSVVQFLAFAKMKLGLLRGKGIPTESIAALEEAEGLLQQAIDRSRNVMYELSAFSLYDLGFEPALRALCDHFRKEHHLEVQFRHDAEPKPLPINLQIMLFQATRELLMNVVEHAQATLATVTLSRVKDQIAITVSDNGVGFEVTTLEEMATHEGFGLFSIRERLRYLGGAIEVRSQPGEGTTVEIHLPLQAAPGAEG